MLFRQFLILFTFFCFCSLARAQYYKDNKYMIGGSLGYAYPMGDFGNQASGGVSVRLKGQMFLNKKISVGAEIANSFLGQNDFWDGSHLGSYDVNYHIASVLMNGAFYLDSWDKDFRPYIALDFGYFLYRNKIDFIAASAGVTTSKRTIKENKFGLAPNVGFFYHLSNWWSFEMNLRYTIIPNFPESVPVKEQNGEKYPYYLGFKNISLPEFSLGFYYRF